MVSRILSYERHKIEECINVSSRRRKARADQLKIASNKKVYLLWAFLYDQCLYRIYFKELIDIASDTVDSLYPIFRSTRKDDPNELKTIATGLLLAAGL